LLNRRLFARTADCAAQVLGADRLLVVSPDDAVIEAAAALGLTGLREPDGTGLNGALDLASRAASAKGANALLSLSCDLPCLSATDLVAALAAWPGADSVLLAPDEAGTGTNALIVPVRSGFSYAMGSDSATRHREGARRAHLPLVEISRPGLSFDLDTPDDLARWRTSLGESAAA
jgi:2-phospho-L-lactate guanylyltransferase